MGQQRSPRADILTGLWLPVSSLISLGLSHPCPLPSELKPIWYIVHTFLVSLANVSPRLFPNRGGARQSIPETLTLPTLFPQAISNPTTFNNNHTPNTQFHIDLSLHFETHIQLSIQHIFYGRKLLFFNLIHLYIAYLLLPACICIFKK